MAFSINEVKQTMGLGGARPSLFMVQITNPIDGSASLQIPFRVKAASIPASRIGQIEVPYFGRTVKLAGDREYDNWPVQIMDDEDFLVRNALESWHSWLNSSAGNLRAGTGLQYKSSAIVTQFAKTGGIIRQYQLEGIFPLEIGQIDLGWDRINAIEDFGVVFAVDRWYTLPSATGVGEANI